jgi:hypothetical protein
MLPIIIVLNVLTCIAIYRVSMRVKNKNSDVCAVVVGKSHSLLAPRKHMPIFLLQNGITIE